MDINGLQSKKLGIYCFQIKNMWKNIGLLMMQRMRLKLFMSFIKEGCIKLNRKQFFQEVNNAMPKSYCYAWTWEAEIAYQLYKLKRGP